MAVTTSFKSAISRIKSRRRKPRDLQADNDYAPPLGPPPSKKIKNEDTEDEYVPEILPVELPLILPNHQFNLAAQGWTTVTMTQDPHGTELRKAVESLFSAGQAFFDREEEYKSKYVVTEMGSEEGWNSIPGEKEFITIRSTQKLPDELAQAATSFWGLAGMLLIDMLAKIAESLELCPEALMRFAEPCAKLGSERTASMLRVFRYEGWEDKVVAEPHCDLGLLSLVAGKSPGLEVWNAMDQSFFPIEKSYRNLSSVATVLGGRQLQRLTNGTYNPGGHRVKSYSNVKGNGKQPAMRKYRYSIVFVMRAHYPVIVHTDQLTSRITGESTTLTEGMTMRDLFNQIKGAHYNINSGLQDRDEQKRLLKEQNQGSGVTG